MEKHRCKAVLVVPIAYGASYLTDWSPGGPQFRRLMFALRRLQAAKIEIDALCWQQGEAEANHTLMKAPEYRELFLAMLRAIRRAGVAAPLYAAVSTHCDRPDNPHRNHAEIRRALQGLPSLGRGVRPGPDTDPIGPEHRKDGCHFSASGLDLAAAAWYRALDAAPSIFDPVVPQPTPPMSRSPWTGAILESTGMLGIAKQVLLHRLERFGYVLLKSDAHREMLTRAARPEPSSAPTPAPEPPAVPIPPPPAEPPVVAPQPWPAAPAGLFPFAAEAELAAFRRTLPPSLDLPDRRVLALFSAAKDLVCRRVRGDVIDCTHAGEKVLAVLGAAFVFLEDTSRRLVICDPTADPHHRAEHVLQLWGNDFDLLGDKRRPAKSPGGEPPPGALRQTGYPRDKLLVWRYPREPIATSQPIAFLGLTSETYPSNCWAMAAFLDQLADGGVLTVDRITQRDGVAEQLAARQMTLSVSEVADGYRMGVKQPD